MNTLQTKPNKIRSYGKSQRGVGLIEVLFAVLVLAIGLLGMAGLQLTSIRNSQSAMVRGMAVVQAHSIIAAMQADKLQGVMPDTYNIALTATPPTGTDFRAQAIVNWRNGITTAMGAGSTGGVNCTPIPGTVDFNCAITIQWDDSRAQDRSTTTPVAITDLQLQVVI